jgi:hypothetical protein
MCSLRELIKNVLQHIEAVAQHESDSLSEEFGLMIMDSLHLAFAISRYQAPYPGMCISGSIDYPAGTLVGLDSPSLYQTFQGSGNQVCFPPETPAIKYTIITYFFRI